jgi:hypothetical protein
MKKLILVIVIAWCLPGGVGAFVLKGETPRGPLRIAAEYRDLLPGSVIAIMIETPALSEAWAQFGEKRYPFVSRAGGRSWFTLIDLGLDISPGPHALRVSVACPDGYEKTFSVTLTVTQRPFPVKRLTVDDRFTVLSPDVLKRVLREKREIEAVHLAITPSWLGEGGFEVPSPGVLRDNFGEKRLFNGEVTSRHRGVDIRCPEGTEVRAANAGRVVLAGNFYFGGNTVIIDHGAGLFSNYCHLSAILVRNGSLVEKGAVIGRVGSTGRATGSHLHWGFRLHNEPVDPHSVMHLP